VNWYRFAIYSKRYNRQAQIPVARRRRGFGRENFPCDRAATSRDYVSFEEERLVECRVKPLAGVKSVAAQIGRESNYDFSFCLNTPGDKSCSGRKASA